MAAGGGDEAAGAFTRVWTEVRRPGQGPCCADGIARSLRMLRGRFEQTRDAFIRLDRCIGEMPCVTVGPVGQNRGQAQVGGAAFLEVDNSMIAARRIG